MRIIIVLLLALLAMPSNCLAIGYSGPGGGGTTDGVPYTGATTTLDMNSQHIDSVGTITLNTIEADGGTGPINFSQSISVAGSGERVEGNTYGNYIDFNDKGDATVVLSESASSNTISGNYVFVGLSDVLLPIDAPGDNEVMKYDASLKRLNYEADAGAAGVGTLDQVTNVGASTSNQIAVGALGTSGAITGSTVSAGTVTGNLVFAEKLLDHNLTTLASVNATYGQFGATINASGSTVTVGGPKVFISAPYDGTIVEATVLNSVAGSIVIDVYKDTFGNFPPTRADRITGISTPSITTGTTFNDTTLTGWTTSFSEGDVFGFYVDSITTVSQSTIMLRVQKD